MPTTDITPPACRLATWNVNSLKVRLPHVLDWLASAQPDLLGLQEIKMEDAHFPLAAIEEAGYQAVFAGQKTYNGVAVLIKNTHHKPLDIITDFADLSDPQRRILAVTVGDIRFINLYIPNGQAVGSDKYAYKLEWLNALVRFISEQKKHYQQIAIVGDFNIAPTDEDVHDPSLWVDQILCSQPERAAFDQLLALGFHDAFRLFERSKKEFSWWDYRQMGFRRNIGLRIDHILLSTPLSARCTHCEIDKAPRKLERPSDHTPVFSDLSN